MYSTIFSSPILLFLTFFTPNFLCAQKIGPGYEILSRTQITTLLNDSVKKEFKINYPVFRVYKYEDKSGQYLCVLSESNDSIAKGEDKVDTFNHSIKAINLKIDNNRLSKTWELNDFVNMHENGETSIWFWTSYFSFKDYDDDGLIDPVLVYGTSTDNGYDDGRIKFIIYYKGKKIAIRHQNSTLDVGRRTEADASYASLPKKLKDDIQVKMELMKKQGKAIFYKI
ncbi:M949_RS01915 family surface polysaccharide biosynthesis protein [Flavitalea flava]